MAGTAEEDGTGVPVPGSAGGPGDGRSVERASGNSARAEATGAAAVRGGAGSGRAPRPTPEATSVESGPSPDGEPTVPIGSDRAGVGETSPRNGGRSRFTAANAMIAVLLALLGFTLVVQLRTNSSDASLESARQEDLVRILSDLDAQEERVRQDIAGLEESQRQLSSGAEGRQAALEEARRRADELGILAGSLPARGPGLTVTFTAVSKPVAASRVLDAVQELRGAGAEAMQIMGGNGVAVRIVASTYFLDADQDISVDGRRLTGPYTITVIGDPKTMRTALNIPGGVVASVSGDGGNVAIQERDVVEVTAVSPRRDLQYARPVS
jgi:uncharacterized protein YlxW (UPF0749 family)